MTGAFCSDSTSTARGTRENSLHKLDTLVAALRVLREALVKEFEPYEERARALRELKEHLEDVQDEPRAGRPHGGPARLTPWPSGEARACKARTRQFESARCLSPVEEAHPEREKPTRDLAKRRHTFDTES